MGFECSLQGRKPVLYFTTLNCVLNISKLNLLKVRAAWKKKQARDESIKIATTTVPDGGTVTVSTVSHITPFLNSTSIYAT